MQKRERVNELTGNCTVLQINSLPFKGKGTLEAEQRARVGMGLARCHPTPIPTFPLKGKELLRSSMEHSLTQYK